MSASKANQSENLAENHPRETTVLSLDRIVDSLTKAILPTLQSQVVSLFEQQTQNSAKKSEGKSTSDTFSSTGSSDILPNDKRSADWLSDSEPGELGSECDLEPDDTRGGSKWIPCDSTTADVHETVKKSLSSSEKRAIFRDYPFPQLPAVMPPKLDDAFVQHMKHKNINIRQIPGLNSVESIQKSLLYSWSPLIHLHDCATDACSQGNSLDPKQVVNTLNASLFLLGNCNSQAIYERRKLILKAIQPKLEGYADRNVGDVTSTDLFGEEIRTKITNAITLNKELSSFERSLPSAKKPRFSGGNGYRADRKFSQGQVSNGHYHAYGNKQNKFPYAKQKPYTQNFSRGQPKKPGTILNNFPKSLGRLKLCSEFWQSLTNDPWVLDTVKGYKLPFISIPPQNRTIPHNPVPIDQWNIVDTEIQKMLEKGAIVQTNDIHFLSPIFTVPKKSGGHRVVISLKKLNKFLKVEHFKMERVTAVKDLLEEGMWKSEIDLEDAYYSISIAEEDSKYLQFVWNNKTYSYVSLPFGLSTAPYVFTKLLKPVVAYLRLSGLRLVIYLDDILLMSCLQTTLQQEQSLCMDVLVSCGYTINMKKSELVPTQKIEFLGLLINSESMSFSTPKDKILKITTLANTLLCAEWVTPREVAKFTGTIISLQLCIPNAPLHIRALQQMLINVLRTNNTWDCRCHLTCEAKNDLQWWSLNMCSVPPAQIHMKQADLVIETDASNTGWGARCGPNSTGGKWSKEDLSNFTHINSLELMAAFLGIQCFVKTKTNCSILIKLDNKSAVAYINKLGGTRSAPLNSLALELWDWCLQRSLWLVAEYLPGRLKSLGGLRISPSRRFQRLATSPGDCSSTFQFPRTLSGGLVCESNESSTHPLLELEVGSVNGRNRQFLNLLERSNRIRVPTFLSDRELHTEVPAGSGDNIVGCPSLAKSVLVPAVGTEQRSSTDPSTGNSRPVDGSAIDISSFDYSESSNISCLGSLRGPSDSPGVSTRASELISAAVRPGTQRSYSSAWKTFGIWCNSKGIDPISVSVPNVVNYLAFLECEKKLSYRTINVHRSALSHYLPSYESFPIGSHPKILRLMKGIFNSNPQTPRYTETWDVGQVVSFISGLPSNNDLSLAQLSRKLVVLFAITKADRSSDIKSLDISSLSYLPDGALFKFKNLEKTSRPSRLLDSFYPSYNEDQKLCVVTTLKSYIARTSELRSTSTLIISFQRPHKPVSTSTIARWILQILKDSGIDTEKFKAHSTRSASTTKAKSLGVSVGDITSCANWTNANTFTKFYYRPKYSTSFATAILNSGGNDPTTQ